MSDDGPEQDTDEQTFRVNSKERTTDGVFSKSRSRDVEEALGGEREVPDDADHISMAPDHIPSQMRTDDGSSSGDE